jgi:nucleoid-associated protein EbfC
MSESSHEAEHDPLAALGLGGDGGFDMGALLQQAQQMQQQLQDAQRALAESTVEGSAGGGAVTVTVSGVGELTAITILPGQFDASDSEALDDLGDLIVAAYRDAKHQADTLAAEALGPMAQAMGGSGFPGLG